MESTKRRHLLSLRDLDADDLRLIVDRACAFAEEPARSHDVLSGAVVGIYFRKTSTRTRTAFSVGAQRLGASIVSYGPDDLQENTGETIEDTGRVLSRMLDGFVARTAGPVAELEKIAQQDRMAVINAMAAEEHPTQALADLAAMQRRFGELRGLRVLYVGEGNNSASALARALALIPDAVLDLRTPPGYGLDERLVTELSAEGASVTQQHTMDAPLPDADVVYTTRWQTTGTAKPDPNWRDAFAPFQVNDDVMHKVGRAIFMHDLPAHRGEEVTASVLDGPSSIAFDQAEMKLYSAMAALQWCLVGQFAAVA